MLITAIINKEKMAIDKLFKSKPGQLLSKGIIKRNTNKSKDFHPDLLGVYQDITTGNYKRIALWENVSPKHGKYLNFQITELDEDYVPSKGDLF